MSPYHPAHELNSPASDAEIGEVVERLTDHAHRLALNMQGAMAIDLRKAADLLTRLSEDKARLEESIRAKSESFERAFLAVSEERNRAWDNERSANARADKAEADLSALRARVAEVLEPALRELKAYAEMFTVISEEERETIRRAAELHATLTPKEP